MAEKTAPRIDSTHCIHEAILCSGNNDVDHISGKFLNSVNGKIKINVDPISSCLLHNGIQGTATGAWNWPHTF
jgi:hypothetical protein